MRSLFLFSALALAASVWAQDIDSNDVPSQCKDACASVVSLTARCDNSTHDDDSAEMKCVCDDPGASNNVPNCAACLDKYGKDGKDNDANDIVRKCSFASTTYDPTMTSTSTSNPASSPASNTTSATAESSTPPSAGHSTGLTPGLLGLGIGISLLGSAGL